MGTGVLNCKGVGKSVGKRVGGAAMGVGLALRLAVGVRVGLVAVPVCNCPIPATGVGVLAGSSFAVVSEQAKLASKSIDNNKSVYFIPISSAKGFILINL
jgi:hypothetical protein